MTLQDWKRLNTRQNKDAVSFYGLHRSGTIKTIQNGQVSVFEDDGIREANLEPIAHLSFEDVVALKPIDSVSIPEVKAILEKPVEKAKPIKKAKKAK